MKKNNIEGSVTIPLADFDWLHNEIEMLTLENKSLKEKCKYAEKIVNALELPPMEFIDINSIHTYENVDPSARPWTRERYVSFTYQIPPVNY